MIQAVTRLEREATHFLFLAEMSRGASITIRAPQYKASSAACHSGKLDPKR
jgi:hypothetical protein